jgi:DNA uptake protein ComE-like DNA-binding protein
MAVIDFAPGQIVFHNTLGREVEILSIFSSHLNVKDGDRVIGAALGELRPVRTLNVIEGKKPEDLQPGDRVKINEVTLSELTSAIPGIGRVTAKKLLDRKPKGGYVGFEQLRIQNQDVQLDWEKILPLLEF